MKDNFSQESELEHLLSALAEHGLNHHRQQRLAERANQLALSSLRRVVWPFSVGVAAAACLLALFLVPSAKAPQLAQAVHSPSPSSKQQVPPSAVPSGLVAPLTEASPKIAPSMVHAVKTSDRGPNEQVLSSEPSQASPAEIAPVSPSEPFLYAYSETEDGIRVYCENQCNANEVMAHIEEVIVNSIATL